LHPWVERDWGHATSQDLYTWHHQPIAIPDTVNGSIWSGSIVIDVNNTSGFFPKQSNGVVAIYTNFTPDEEAQAIAYSFDGGYTFTQYSGNPVISLKQHDFRDPSVVWHEKTKKWVMVVSQVARSSLEFYTSPNLLNWTHVSTFSNPFVSGAFECPQFRSIPFRQGSTVAETITAASTGEYYLLVTSIANGRPGGGAIVKYFPGTFNGTHFTSVDNYPDRVIDFGLDAYATAFFSNLHAPEDPNPMSLSWAINLAYYASEPTAEVEGWRGALNGARTHYLANITSQGWDLITEPYDISPMQERLLFSETRLEDGGLVLDYSSISSGALAFYLNVTTTASSLSNASIELDFQSSSTGESINLSLNLQTFLNAAKTTATFSMTRANIAGWSKGKLDTATLSNLVPFRSVSSAGSTVETFQISGILDRSMLETFVNGGLNAGTMIFFPLGKLNTIALTMNGLGKKGYVDFEVWGLRSGWGPENSNGETVRSGEQVVFERQREIWKDEM
jgi:beta-fructofuranosidase